MGRNSEYLLNNFGEMKNNSSFLKGLFVILFTGVLVSSCKKDEFSAEDNLVGTWTATSTDANATVGGKTMVQYFTDLGYSAGDAQLLANLFKVTLQQNFTGTITFNADKTYTANLGGQSDTGTWNISSDAKQLTLDSSTEPAVVLNIDKLTPNELEVSWTETGQEDINNDNVAESITVNIKLVFDK